MRKKLLAAGRKLFAEQGFADTGTPQIVKEAAVTRGALYHHFADKTALFRAVAEAEAAQVAAEIRKGDLIASNSLEAGGRAYFKAMSVPGRARILLRDGPGVLGQVDMDRIDAGAGRATLVEGLRHWQPDMEQAEHLRLAVLISAAFDRAALAVGDGDNADDWLASLTTLTKSIVG
ncbi:helix-turn-helix domain-containing protein [Yoonia sp. SS1-5]|uniref:Helix-turn-helix domain-containing protein n=1 Tax=Yoonia rhodophyticola TaxID=3137370 RepID=A0AAN0M9F2_9RHOB